MSPVARLLRLLGLLVALLVLAGGEVGAQTPTSWGSSIKSPIVSPIVSSIQPAVTGPGAAWSPGTTFGTGCSGTCAGDWWRFSSGVTKSGSNVSSIVGMINGAVLSAPTNSIVPLATDSTSGQPWAQIRVANVTSGVDPNLASTSTSVLPTTINGPFTLAMAIQIVTENGNGPGGGFAQLGGVAGALSGSDVGTANPGVVGWSGSTVGPSWGSFYSPNNSQLLSVFGQRLINGSATSTQYLATGAAQSTLPSKLTVSVSYDGTTLKSWVNGVLADSVAPAYSMSLMSGSVILGRYYSGWAPPDHNVYELVAIARAWTTAEQKAYTAYAGARYAFPANQPNYTVIGDSIAAGYESTNNATASYSRLAANAWTAAPYSQPVAWFVYNSAVSGTSTSDFVVDGHGVVPVANWADATYAYGYDPLAPLSVLTANWMTNDYGINLGSYWQANVVAIGDTFRKWNYSAVVWQSPPPFPPGSISGPQAAFYTSSIAWLNGYGVGAGVATFIDDLTNTSDSVTLAAAGVPAWAGSTAYVTTPSTVAQGLSTYGGHLWWCAISGTSQAAGGPAADNLVTSGMWLDLGAAGSLGDLATVLLGTAPHDGVHLGTNSGIGNCGSAVVAVQAAAGVARATGYGGLLSIAGGLPANDNALAGVLVLGLAAASARRRAAHARTRRAA